MNAAKLGARTATVACVGHDEKGDLILDFYRRLGIDCSMVQRTDKAPTSATILTIRPNGERPALHCRGASDWLFVPDAGFDAVCDARILHLGGTGLHRGDGRRTEREAHAPRQSEGPYDDFRPYRAEREDARAAQRSAAVDRLFHAFARGGGVPLRPRRSGRRRFLLHGPRRRAPASSRWARQGSYARTRDGQFRTPAFKVPVSDTTGCGDAYCGGFVAGLVEGLNLEAACRLGAATAAPGRYRPRLRRRRR